MLRSTIVFQKTWSFTTGTAQPTVPLRAIRDLEIPAPVLEEQKRITIYLDSLQAKVDGLKALQSQSSAELNALLPSTIFKAFSGQL